MQEKPGATRIISILPEGTRVKAGQLVCEFDSSAFRDEVQAQKIRYVQAEAWVKQAEALLAVSKISLREYRDGIYPQDRQLIQQYIATCEITAERARRNLAWSKETMAKGFRTPTQVNADALTVQQAELELNDAKRMAERLEVYTMPKLMKALEAKLEAINADLFSQKAAFQLESDRLRRLETMVKNCTLLAPRDGIVVYENQTNGWGSVEAQIQEGVTVREGQPIFSVPDPRTMQVKAKINESKVAQIESGQSVLIRVDAFPKQPLRGTVSEVTAIPAPANRASDVKIYFATVKIAQGFDGLRPGLSAEVDFYLGTRDEVTRIPVQAVREVDGQAFAALTVASASQAGTSWRWVPITLGQSNELFAEVVEGLKPGDRVVAEPETLTPPPQPKTAPMQTAAR
jgi:multidrug efflux pump subunit AcrA (membrane-fusion protein)